MILLQLKNTWEMLRLIAKEVMLNADKHGLLPLRKTPIQFPLVLLSDVPLEPLLRERKTLVVPLVEIN